MENEEIGLIISGSKKITRDAVLQLIGAVATMGCGYALGKWMGDSKIAALLQYPFEIVIGAVFLISFLFSVRIYLLSKKMAKEAALLPKRWTGLKFGKWHLNIRKVHFAVTFLFILYCGFVTAVRQGQNERASVLETTMVK